MPTPCRIGTEFFQIARTAVFPYSRAATMSSDERTSLVSFSLFPDGNNCTLTDSGIHLDRDPQRNQKASFEIAEFALVQIVPATKRRRWTLVFKCKVFLSALVSSRDTRWKSSVREFIPSCARSCVRLPFRVSLPTSMEKQTVYGRASRPTIAQVLGKYLHGSTFPLFGH